jgi:glycosyltransferase involved in cell wall biosynthesis
VTPELQLVLPCYNEARNLEALVRRAAAAARSQGYLPGRFELVLVENGSHDDSAQVMERLKADPELGPWFRVVRVAQNRGYGFGIWSGLQTVTAPWVAWSHADQQCDPGDAFRGLRELQAAGGDRVLVKGRRRGRDWKEWVVSRVFETIASALLGRRLSEVNAQPKVFPRALLAELRRPPETFAFDLYVLYRARRAGYRIREIPVSFPPRVHGVSNWASSLASRARTIRGMLAYIWWLRGQKGLE